MSDIYNSTSVKTFINNIKVQRVTDTEISNDYCIISTIHGSKDDMKVEDSIQKSEKIEVKNIHDDFIMGIDFSRSEYRRFQQFPVDNVSVVYHCFGNFKDRLNEIRRNQVIYNAIIESVESLGRKDKNITINIEKLVQPKISSRYE